MNWCENIYFLFFQVVNAGYISTSSGPDDHPPPPPFHTHPANINANAADMVSVTSYGHAPPLFSRVNSVSEILHQNATAHKPETQNEPVLQIVNPGAGSDLQLTSLTYENCELERNLASLGASSMRSNQRYYEDVIFQNGNPPSGDAKPTKCRQLSFEGRDDGADYEEVIVDNSLLQQQQYDVPSSVHKYSYNNADERDYVNMDVIVVQNQKNLDSQMTSAGSSLSGDCNGAASPEVESMFSIARRFPSIRLNASAKKAKKRQEASIGDNKENFPRDSGNNVSLTFGSSLDRLYSQPEKNGINANAKVTELVDQNMKVQ